MIKGSINSKLDATINSPIVDSVDNEHKTEFIIDTGFSGFATLPTSAIRALELPWQCRQEGVLADGSVILLDVHLASIQ